MSWADCFRRTCRIRCGNSAETFWTPTSTQLGGGDLWRTRDGIDWVSGYPKRVRANRQLRRSLAEGDPWGLLVGLADPVAGFEIWMGKRDDTY